MMATTKPGMTPAISRSPTSVRPSVASNTDGAATHEERRRDEVGGKEGDRHRNAEHHQAHAEAEEHRGGPIPLHAYSCACAVRLPRKFSRRTRKRVNSIAIIAKDSGMKPTT